MPRFALQLPSEIVEQLFEMFEVDKGPATEFFSQIAYLVMEPVSTSPLEFNVKFLTEDQIFEAAANDPELEIMTF